MPCVIACGLAFSVGIGYSVISPAVVILPILFPLIFTNQSAPSVPLVIPTGPDAGVGIGYSVISPEVETLPILLT